MTPHPRVRRMAATMSLAALAFPAIAARAQAPQLADLPFAPGEKLEFSGRVHVGVSVHGTMRVEGPAELRGTSVWTLHSDIEGKLGFVKASNRAVSWIEPVHMAAMRYTSRERHLLAKSDDDISIFPSEKR